MTRDKHRMLVTRLRVVARLSPPVVMVVFTLAFTASCGQPVVAPSGNLDDGVAVDAANVDGVQADTAHTDTAPTNADSTDTTPTDTGSSDGVEDGHGGDGDAAGLVADDGLGSQQDGFGQDGVAGDDNDASQDAGPVGDECLTNFDCKDEKGVTPCNLPLCSHGYCGWSLRKTGTACKDPALAETACKKTTCDAAGVCTLGALAVGTLCEIGHSIGDCELALCDAGQNCAVAAKTDEKNCGVGACGYWCQSGKCVTTPQAAFDDSDPCTNDYCDQNTKIVHEAISGGVCDDGDPCTGDGTCKLGACTKTDVGGCNDGLPCTVDTCTATGCSFTPNNTGCKTNDPCFKMVCDAAIGCKKSTVLAGANCDDGDSCTKVDVCSKSGACEGTKNACTCTVDAQCKDNNKCLPRTCNQKSGTCEVAAENQVVCLSGTDNFCRKNTCDPTTGKCVFVGLQAGKKCDDNDVCTKKSTCVDGTCAGGKRKVCDDGELCTKDVCDALKNCVTSPAAGKCDDGVICTSGDTCTGGICAGKKRGCDDSIACTFDSCDPKTGLCIHTVTKLACADDNPCTTDTCIVTKGCANTPNNQASCDDGDVCTTTACQAGKCVVKSIKKTLPGCACKVNKGCNDNNPCTKDSCISGDCVFVFKTLEGSACKDANPCVVDSTCSKGSCAGGKSKVCSDANPCTSDSCNPATGDCVATAKSDATICDADGNACTVVDGCRSGVCTPGVKVSGGTCSDGVACTSGDSCSKGTCVGKPVVCDDGNICTVDSCHIKSGACLYKPTNGGAICALKSVCGKGVCGPVSVGWARDIETGGMSRHICALRHDKTMACWGRNKNGQIGTGFKNSAVTKPVIVAGLTNVKQMAVGENHTCGLRQDGKLFCWGNDSHAQLGLGSGGSDKPKPVWAKAVPLLSGVWAGLRRTCGQDLAGKLRCWGYGPAGERGDGTTSSVGWTPKLVVGLPLGKKVLQVDIRERRSCVIVSGGTLWCWGSNKNGDVSLSPSSSIAVATKRASLTGVTLIGGGRDFACAIASQFTKGTCWGRNGDGQLGVGSGASRVVNPQPLFGAIVQPMSFVGGRRHLIIVGTDGMLYGAGATKYGAIGAPTSFNQRKLVKATLFSATYVKAVAFDQTTCALGVDGQVYCVGYNGNGQFGTGWTFNATGKLNKVLKP